MVPRLRTAQAPGGGAPEPGRAGSQLSPREGASRRHTGSLSSRRLRPGGAGLAVRTTLRPGRSLLPRPLSRGCTEWKDTQPPICPGPAPGPSPAPGSVHPGPQVRAASPGSGCAGQWFGHPCCFLLRPLGRGCGRLAPHSAQDVGSPSLLGLAYLLSLASLLGHSRDGGAGKARVAPSAWASPCHPRSAAPAQRAPRSLGG